MYIFKNAIKCISRSKGRNVLIGIIVLTIAISACIGLSIKQAAQTSKKETLSSMSVTATISFDRSSMMNNMGEGGQFDPSQFATQMGQADSLSLEDYQKYASASSVKEFYYSLSTTLNGDDNFNPVTTETEDETETEENNMFGFGGMGMGMDMGGNRFGNNGEFSVTGYSGESAMTDFVSGTATISDGDIFEEGTDEYDCIISDELATFNNLTVGSSISLTNPNDEEEIYSLTVVGFYTDSSANTDTDYQRFGATSSDPANRIYLSYNALQKIIDNSQSVATTETDEVSGMERSSAVTGSLNAVYSFADTDDYYTFEEEVRDLGLDDSFAVSSTDLQEFENSLMPLNTLSTMAGTFLIVILIIGAIILIVLNIFNIRERKYEIGVLTAMGMKKGKVALQFITEIFVVTMAAVIIGVGVGAMASVPVTNALLENQVVSSQTNNDRIEQNFGRGDMGNPPQIPQDNGGGFGDRFQSLMGMNPDTSYVTEVSSAMNFTVVWQMMGIALLLTLVSGSVSMLFIMRYEPLKILANRD